MSFLATHNTETNAILFVQIISLASVLYLFWTKDKLQSDLLKIKNALSHVSINNLFLSNQELNTKTATRLFDLCKSVVSALAERKFELEDKSEIIANSTTIAQNSANSEHSNIESIEYLQKKLADKVIASAIILKVKEGEKLPTFIASSRIAKRLERVIVSSLDDILDKHKEWGYQDSRGVLEDFRVVSISRSFFCPLKNKSEVIGALWLGFKNEHSFLNKQEEFILRTLSEQLVANLSQDKNTEQVQHRVDDLLLGISHDLKAPNNSSLSVVRGFLSGDFGEVSSEQFVLLKLLESSLEEQQGLVLDILDFAKSKQGNLECQPKIVEPNCLLSEIIEREKFNAEQKSLNFICRELPNCFVNIDPKHARRILGNLLSNAVKYTDKGQIELSFSLDSSYLKIKVSDTGIGIPKDEVDKIFNSFSRCKNTENYSGTGLGLSISKYLAELNSGFVNYQPNHSSGSTFEFGIKLAPKIRFKRIFIIEDDEATLRSHQRFLKDFTDEIVSYQNITNAIRDLYRQKPDLIISDIYLNEETSLPLIPLIPLNTPLIIVSGHSNNKLNEISSLKTRELYFLDKPMDRTKIQCIFQEIASKDTFIN